MKKLIVSALAMTMAFPLSACGNKSVNNIETTPTANKVSVGSWTIAQDESIPREAIDALNKALERVTGASYELVRLLATQVVAGTNYAILCRVTPVYPDAASSYSIAYVCADLERNAELLRTQDLINTGDEEITDGWTAIVTEEDAAAADAALSKAAEALVGASYETVTVLAKQTVAGADYLLLCKVTPVVPDAEGTYCLVTVYEDPDGQAELTVVDQLEYSLEENA